MVHYSLHVMGPLSLTHSGDCQAIRLSNGTKSLLALLALRTSRAPLSRDKIASTLWPDLSTVQSRSCLNTAIWRLRRSVGGNEEFSNLIEKSRGAIGLARNGGLSVDIWEMERLSKQLRKLPLEQWTPSQLSTLEGILQNRSGHFFEGIEGDWVDDAERCCTEIYESALECLICFHRHRGNVDPAISAARMLVRDNPYREDIHAALIELYTNKGQRTQAIAQYNACCEMLDEELGLSPGDNLRQSLSHALKGSREPGIPPDVHEAIREIGASMELLVKQVNDLRNMIDGAPASKRR